MHTDTFTRVCAYTRTTTISKRSLVYPKRLSEYSKLYLLLTWIKIRRQKSPSMLSLLNSLWTLNYHLVMWYSNKSRKKNDNCIRRWLWSSHGYYYSSYIIIDFKQFTNNTQDEKIVCTQWCKLRNSIEDKNKYRSSSSLYNGLNRFIGTLELFQCVSSMFHKEHLLVRTFTQIIIKDRVILKRHVL